MSTPNEQHAHPTDPPGTASASKSTFPKRIRWIVQIVTLCVLVALAGIGGYLLHGTPGSPSPDSQVPPSTPVPAHASLVRTELYLNEHIQNWYYTIPHSSVEEGMAFYQSQLPQWGWQCVTEMTNTNISYAGQMLSGTGIYITALRGATKAQIYVGDQAYGSWLLQYDLSDDAIALKVSLEPAGNQTCP